MKSFLAVLLALGIGGSATWVIVSNRESARHAAELKEKEAAWQREKTSLESALKDAQTELADAQGKTPRTKVVEVAKKQSAKEIIENLKTLRVGARDTKNVRLIIQQFENLVELGKESLAPIQGFLAQQEDIEYDRSIFGSWKISKEGNVPIDFVFPPSLRFGLFDVVRQIGGEEAEKILADTLRITGRGVEVAYLTRVLHQIAPFKYRELAVSAAKELLNNPLNANSANPLDKFERNYLFGVLAFYNDGSLANQAQAQLVQTDGKIDQGALHYLQQTMGVQALPYIEQAYQNPAIDPDKKEPLVRYALNFAGVDPQATAFWHKAVTDPTFPMDHRRELIEDLNQDGFQNEKNPTPQDARLIAARLALIEKHWNEVDDPKIKDAWHEAGRDLKNMGLKFLSKPGDPPLKTEEYTLGENVTDLLDTLKSAPIQ